MLYIKSDDKYPLQYFLYQQVNNIEQYKKLISNNAVNSAVINAMSLPTQTLKMALTIVVTGPIILAFPMVQKYFVQGITIGAVKG
jgi:putative aldouronate transport system permease protein